MKNGIKKFNFFSLWSTARFGHEMVELEGQEEFLEFIVGDSIFKAY
jgi:hypothetical protein